MINTRFALTTEQLISMQAQHLLRVVDLLLLRSNNPL
jgi:hypothetical protein